MNEKPGLAVAILKLSPFEAWVIGERCGLNGKTVRGFHEMTRDCGLSMYRLRQVEKTALDKLSKLMETEHPRGTMDTEEPISLEDIKVKSQCPACLNRGFVDESCHRCQGRNVHVVSLKHAILNLVRDHLREMLKDALD